MTRLSVIDAVRLYAESVGCPVFDADRQRFYAPDRSRSVRHVEHRGDTVTVWDTGVPSGYVPISRERRPTTKATQRTDKQNEPKADEGESGDWLPFGAAGERA